MPIHRTPSEALLAELHLDFSELHLKRVPPTYVTDEELSDLDLPSLGQSVVQEQEDRFAMQATKALSFLATPPPPDRGAADVFSPYASRTPVPDAEGDLNHYFARNLYHDAGTHGWTPSASSSSASSSADDSGYSSPASDLEPTPSSCSPSPSLKPVDTSLAARRGRPMFISLPERPNLSAAAVRPPTPKQITGFNFTCNPQEGVLKNNFAGVQLRRSPSPGPASPDIFSAEEALPLRRKPRNHGFAF